MILKYSIDHKGEQNERRIKQNRSVNAFSHTGAAAGTGSSGTAGNPAALMEETPDMDPVQKEMARMELTSEEQKMVDSFAEKIDVEIRRRFFSTEPEPRKMADFSDEALKNVRTQDLGEVGELLTDVVSQLKDFDTEEEKGFFGFFKKQANKIENLKTSMTRQRQM